MELNKSEINVNKFIWHWWYIINEFRLRLDNVKLDWSYGINME